MSKILELKELLESEYKIQVVRTHLENFLRNEALKFNRRYIDVIYHYVQDKKSRQKLFYQL